MADYKDYIVNNLIGNTIEILFPDGDEETITEANIASESMSLKQSICETEALTFGGCIASEFKIDLIKTTARQFSSELTGKWINVRVTQKFSTDKVIYPSSGIYPSAELLPGYAVETKEFYIFSGYVDSVTVNKNDKNVLTVTAYDAFTKLYETDATNMLYENFKSNGNAYYLDRLLNLLLQGISKDAANDKILNERYTPPNEATTSVRLYHVLNNDWMERKDTISYGTLLKNICEMLGVFGVIVPNDSKGTFKMLSLASQTAAEVYGFYETLFTEEYQSTGYTDFKFSVTGNQKTGKSALAGGLSDAVDDAVDKTYDFTENILVWQPYTIPASGTGRYTTDFEYMVNRTSIGKRLALNTEGGAYRDSYQPISATLDGRLWVTVGMPIEILVNQTEVDGSYVLDENGNVQKETVRTYVLSRTLTGIQALTDKIEIKGVR